MDWRNRVENDHLDGARVVEGPPIVPFDPAKCDHGSELMGKREWDHCENCRADLVDTATVEAVLTPERRLRQALRAAGKLKR